MPSTYTPRNRAEKQATGEGLNVWGQNLNQRTTDLFDEALDGVESVNLGAAATFDLSDAAHTKNGESDTSRQRVLIFSNTHASGTAITIPSVEKWYFIRNSGSQAITLAPSGGSTATVAAGADAIVFSNGTNAYLFRQRLNELAAPNGAVSMNSQKITNVADGVAGTDGVNKAQVEALTAADVQLAEDWAKKTTGFVEGSENSARSWAVGGTGDGDPVGGSAKEWATSTTTVDGGLKGARGYANDASGSASSASTSAGNAATSESNAGDSATLAQNWATSLTVVSGGFKGARGYAEDAAASKEAFDDIWVTSASAPSPTQAGMVWFDTAGNVVKVRDATNSNWLAVTGINAASETVAGVIEIATQAETNTGTDDARAVTPKKLAAYSGFAAIDQRFDDIEDGLVAGSPVPTTSGSSIDFINLDCDELHLFLNAVSTVASAAIQLAFSTNNGSSWSTAIQVVGGNTGASAAKTDSVRVLGLKSGHVITLGGGTLASSLPSSGNNGYVGRVNVGGAVNAVRLVLSASTFNGGSVTPLMAV